MRHNNQKLTWPQFESCNPDTQFAFERMCRLLFNHHFFDGKAITHSNPNNPGIEVLPIFHESSNKRISFQSKYLSANNYSQIHESAKKIIEYYVDEIDVVYLYCNRDLTTTSEPYMRIERLLYSNGIKLIPVNNQSILEQVLLYPVIATSYFGHHAINRKWFKEKLQESLDMLGSRHNKLFNVDTQTEKYLDLFTHNNSGILNIEHKKVQAIEEIERMRNFSTSQDDYLLKAKMIIQSLDVITINNIYTCLEWESRLYDELKIELTILRTQYDEIEKEINKKTSEDNYSIGELFNKKRKILELIEIPELLRITNREKSLIENKVLILKGDAGVGKSQLFAHVSKKNIDTGGFSVLMLGQSFLNSDSIFEQAISKINLDRNFDEFLQILESIGEEHNQFVTLFFDAINESNNKEIWKLNINQIINKVNSYNYLRIAFSLRSGYENSLIDSSIENKIKNDEICVLYHEGFKNESIEATKQFLDWHNIPFSPASFLQFEITNPLFLTLFCITYSGEEIDMLALFKKLIKNADLEIQKFIDFDGSIDLLTHLIDEIVEFNISNKSRSISKHDLLRLSYWEMYGITSKKIPFLSVLEKTDILHNLISKDIEYYYLSYNLLEDFLIAQLITNRYDSKEMLLNYIKEELLLVDGNRFVNPRDVDVFIIVSMLYAEKYNDECINEVWVYINDFLDDYDKRYIISRYIKSFGMRKTSSISKKSFIDFLQKIPVNSHDLWSMLIENSTKTKHPLNADFLHELLIDRPLARRDALWTTYINDLSYSEERLYQLVNLFHSGETLNGLNKKNIKLILTLFTWLLSSSNRDLRDKTSKAMIEILKNNFDLCTYLLKKFDVVDDPYIIQRLYGIIFGACLGRSDKSDQEFRVLTEYVYYSIFESEIVYPDILLRDYARLIIERYLYEYSEESVDFDFSKMTPPYRSPEIPKVKRVLYNDDNLGFNRIAKSMQPDRVKGPGMYGDFGRYVFESALSNFAGIDIENLYNYSLRYIKEELKYTDELFGDYDSSIHHPYDRGNVDGFERIGKKYQWIAMYHILAKVSDTHQIKGRSEREDYNYKGSYDPYVRDFDPTLNENLTKINYLPKFKYDKNLNIGFNLVLEEKSEFITQWIEEDTPFFSLHSEKLTYLDTTGEEWLLLYQYEEKKYGDRKFIHNTKPEQRMWSMSHSYFVEENQFDNFKVELMDHNFMGRRFPEARSTYTLYNGEYPWSYSCDEQQMHNWYSYEVQSGETSTVKNAVNAPGIFDYLESDYTPKELHILLPDQVREEKEHIKKTIGNIMPTFAELIWEEQYDLSNDERHIQVQFPTKILYDGLKLNHKKNPGYYYDENDELIAFDGSLTKTSSGLLIKKKRLIKFMKEHKLRLFWTSLGEKQYFSGFSNQNWSEWSGFLYLENDKIFGRMDFKNSK